MLADWILFRWISQHDANISRKCYHGVELHSIVGYGIHEKWYRISNQHVPFAAWMLAIQFHVDATEFRIDFSQSIALFSFIRFVWHFPDNFEIARATYFTCIHAENNYLLFPHLTKSNENVGIAPTQCYMTIWRWTLLNVENTRYGTRLQILGRKKCFLFTLHTLQ